MVFLPDVAYAKASLAFESAKALRTALDELGIATINATDDALFLAGRVFQAYKKSVDPRDGVFPDFIVGAVAETFGCPLITFNEKDFVNRFKSLKIVTPQ